MAKLNKTFPNEHQWRRFNELQKQLTDLAMEYENVGLMGCGKQLYDLIQRFEETPGNELCQPKSK